MNNFSPQQQQLNTFSLTVEAELASATVPIEAVDSTTVLKPSVENAEKKINIFNNLELDSKFLQEFEEEEIGLFLNSERISRIRHLFDTFIPKDLIHLLNYDKIIHETAIFIKKQSYLKKERSEEKCFKLFVAKGSIHLFFRCPSSKIINFNMSFEIVILSEIRRLLLSNESEEIISKTLGALEPYVTCEPTIAELVVRQKNVEVINNLVITNDSDEILKKASNFLQLLFRKRPKCGLHSLEFLYPTIFKFLHEKGSFFQYS